MRRWECPGSTLQRIANGRASAFPPRPSGKRPAKGKVLESIRGEITSVLSMPTSKGMKTGINIWPLRESSRRAVVLTAYTKWGGRGVGGVGANYLLKNISKKTTWHTDSHPSTRETRPH